MAKIPKNEHNQNLDDAALVRLIREGDREAGKVLLEKYIPRIQVIVKNRIASPDDRKEIVQKTLIALWENARNGKIDLEKAGKDIGRYVYGIVKKQVSQYYKRMKRDQGNVAFDDSILHSELETGNRDELISKLDEDLFELDKELYEKILLSCLKDLPALHQTVIHLLKSEDFDMKAIGKKLKLSARQVRDKYYFALKKTKKCVQKKLKS